MGNTVIILIKKKDGAKPSNFLIRSATYQGKL